MSTIQHTLQHTIQRAYKTELALNHQQISACKRHAGAARWAYNWGLARKQEAYHAMGTSPSAIDLHRELNALKPTGVPWLYQVSKCAPQEAFRNLDAAFTHFFAAVNSSSKASCVGRWAIPNPRPRSAGWAAFASLAASSSCLTLSSCRGWDGCASRSATICPAMLRSSRPR